MKQMLACLSFVLCAALAWAQQAVLYVGSDWNDAGVPLQAVWTSPGFVSAAGVKLDVVDQPERVDDAVKARWEQQKAVRFELSRIPGFAYFDAQGRCVLLREGLPAAFGEAARTLLLGLIAEGKARAQTIDALLAKHDAEAAGAALALVLPELGQRRSREANGLKAAWDILKAKDPEDKTGWDFALAFDPASSPADKIRGFAEKKDIAGGEAFLRELAAKPQTHLSVNQRQGLMLLRYALLRGDSAQKEAMTKLLRDTLALGADTHFGAAAQGLLCLQGEGPVAVPYGWFPKDAKPGVQTWEVSVGVPRVLRAPGRYALTLRRTQGKGTMTFRKLTFAGRIFDGAKAIPVGGSLEVPFEMRAGDAPVLALTVDFAAPEGERGTLNLRALLPERIVRADRTIEKNARPWTQGSSAVAAEARRRISGETFRDIAAQPGGAAFLRAFFGDTAWMEAFFGSGEPLKGWDESLCALDAIAYHSNLDTPALRKWATAAALNAAADPTEAARLFQTMMALRAEKQLVRGADDQRVDQMRFVMLPAQSNADSARWLAGQHCVPPRQYGGVCWAAPYRLHSFFGDSIHGSDYYKPWEHVYIRHESSRKVGGVCGALSYYGSAAAKAHGVPSTPGGQPGHCAYTVWSDTDGRWELAYNVSPYTGPHFSLWDGRGRFSYQDLAADAFARPGMPESMRLLWAAEQSRTRRTPRPVRSAMTCDAYVWEGRTLPKELTSLQKLGTWRNVTDFNLDQADRADHVLLVWTGTFTASRAMDVEFSLTSDDGAGLWVDGRLIAGKDGLHGMEGSALRVPLSEGTHPFELRWFNYNGGRGLELKVRPGVAYDPQLAEAYLAAGRACPQNLSVWRAYAAWLEACSGVPAEAWQTFGDAAAAGLRDHVEPAWELLQSSLLPALEALGGKAAVTKALVRYHGVIRQGPQNTAEFCDYDRLLDSQAKLLGDDPEACFALFSADLPTQVGTRDAFGRLMKWGGSRFLGNPDLSKRYVAAIDTLLKSKGNEGNALGRYVREAIREASQARNADAFRALCSLQDSLDPKARKPMDFGGFTDLPLLSDRALLRLSSTSGWDHPEAYRHVIDGLAPTQSFHTSEERAPWVEIELPGMAEVGAVWVGNRDSNASRLVPFTIEVSEDGKTWKEVARDNKVRHDYRFTFAPVKAKFVRLTCHPADGGKTFLHLRKFCVFGKKLY